MYVHKRAVFLAVVMLTASCVVSGDCDALHAGWLHGQGTEVHRQSAHANRKVKK